jgi:para-aminobenzoate synthetase/4-amino-4-deoxychorismate lyase
MKGTTRRGRWGAEDERLAEELRRDPKERAENLMIVDLLRNDMGIVSGTGSVRVRSLFDLELLETVHQMTSTIESRLKPEVGLTDLFRALFPCGSVTGAPKKRTMEIIAELEDSPRGLYTGCIGYISPGPEAVFSVAIRTLVVDRETGTAEMGLGSGVTWDSNPESEYRECLAKGRFAERALPDFRLLETLLFEEGAGFFLLDRHLARLSRSASYFCFQLDTVAVGKVLDLRAARLKGAQKVRILVSRSGAFSIESEAIAASDPDAAAVAAFTETTVESADPLLYHKTDNRSFYTAELSKRPDCDEVILCNERGEVTEGTYSNIVARIDGELITPPLEAGLLPGVFREELLETGKISEKSITRKELECAEEIWLINSVRKWRRARLVR